MTHSPQEHDHHSQHAVHDPHAGHTGHGVGSSARMAASATLHCLTGCAVGEILGLMIGTAVGLSQGWTIALAVSLAFFFGYALSLLPLVRGGLAAWAAFRLVVAADTLSIAVMEVVDNLVMALIPGAMDAGLVNVVFWVGMMIALTVAFLAAYPVNKWLLARGQGHALTHGLHGDGSAVRGWRRYVPAPRTGTLVAVLVAFMLGGLVVAAADELAGTPEPAPVHALS